MKCKKCGTNFEGNFCHVCGTPAEPNPEIVQQTNQFMQPPTFRKTKKPIFKKWWFWTIAVVVGLVIIANLNSQNDTTINSSANNTVNTNNDSTAKSNQPEVTVADFSTMDKNAIQAWADTNKVNCKVEDTYSDSVASGSFVSQSVNANEKTHEGETITITFSIGKEPSIEFKNALKKAESYSKLMHMSKKSLYDQLTSEYGEKFSADAAKYAIDTIKADWNENALEKAKSYQKDMNMSASKIFDQLASPYGEKFTKEEAQYAVDHLED